VLWFRRRCNRIRRYSLWNSAAWLGGYGRNRKGRDIMGKIEGLLFSGRVALTTDFGEEKTSRKGTPFRAALARDGRGTTYRLFAFSEATLKQARSFGKGDDADILGEALSIREEAIGLALRDIFSPEDEDKDEEESIPF
jgi:hypothetical protein